MYFIHCFYKISLALTTMLHKTVRLKPSTSIFYCTKTNYFVHVFIKLWTFVHCIYVKIRSFKLTFWFHETGFKRQTHLKTCLCHRLDITIFFKTWVSENTRNFDLSAAYIITPAQQLWRFSWELIFQVQQGVCI